MDPHRTPTAPPVSVIATVRNEERHLDRVVRAVLEQDYPGDLEVVLAIGPSRDNTYGIAAELALIDPRIVVVDNPTGLIPHGLNVALAASDPARPIVVRFDGHAALPHDYISRAVRTLERTGADNVGGIMEPRGTTPIERAIAVGMSHPIGIGPASFHVGGEEGPSETAYLGVFRRAAVQRVGGYDEHFQRAEDWELNLRLRESGSLVWFDPALRVSYHPRSSFRALARQFWSTGRWRRELIRLNPATVSARYLAPPAAVTGIVLGFVLAVVGAAVSVPALIWLGLAAPLGYGLVVLVGAAVAGRGQPWRVTVRLPLVLAVMHLCWGAGFVRGRGQAADS